MKTKDNTDVQVIDLTKIKHVIKILNENSIKIEKLIGYQDSYCKETIVSPSKRNKS